MSTLDRKTYHHGNLRDALLEAGMELLRSGGAEALSLRELARRAEVSQTAPYRHFANREEVLAALAERGFRALADQLRAAEEAAPEAEKLIAQARAYVGFAVSEPALFRLMFGSFCEAGHPGLAQAGAEAFGVLAERVERSTPPAQARTRTLASWALVHGLAMLIIDGRLGEEAARPEALTEAVVGYMDTASRG